MRVKRRIWAIVGVAMAMAIVTAALAWRARAAPPGPAARSLQEAASSGPSVRVERTLVLASEEVVERPDRAGRARARPPRGTAAPPLMSRARRVLFGSGRHRPEPFPRVSEEDSSPR